MGAFDLHLEDRAMRRERGAVVYPIRPNGRVVDASCPAGDFLASQSSPGEEAVHSQLEIVEV